MSRIVITLNQHEREALVNLALAKYRSPQDQAHFILRQELERRGLLATVKSQVDNDKAEPIQVDNVSDDT